MQIWAEPEKSALPICNYSQILYQFFTFTQNLKRSLRYRAVLLESSFFDFSACSFIYFCTASSVILPIVST